MVKNSFIYFGLSCLVFVIIVSLFLLFSYNSGGYAPITMPLMPVPSIILSIYGIRYARSARFEYTEAYSTLAYVCNIILLIFLIIITVLLALNAILLYSLGF